MKLVGEIKHWLGSINSEKFSFDPSIEVTVKARPGVKYLISSIEKDYVWVEGQTLPNSHWLLTFLDEESLTTIAAAVKSYALTSKHEEKQVKNARRKPAKTEI